MALCRPPSRTQLESQARSHERVLQCVPTVVRAGHASRAEALRCWQAGLCAKTSRGCLGAETCHKIFMHDDSACCVSLTALRIAHRWRTPSTTSLPGGRCSTWFMLGQRLDEQNDCAPPSLSYEQRNEYSLLCLTFV